MKSKKDAAYEYILEKINNGTYPAEYYIDEKRIAQELNSSRTPVREAILTLAQENYLKIMPQRGVIVKSFTYQDAFDIFQTRKLIEPWLVRTYGPVLTPAEIEMSRQKVVEEQSQTLDYDGGVPFISMMHQPHTLLLEKCTNQLVLDMVMKLEKLSQHIPNTREVPAKYVSPFSTETYIKVHLDLLDAISEGDYDKACALMMEQIEEAEREYMRYWFQMG